MKSQIIEAIMNYLKQQPFVKHVNNEGLDIFLGERDIFYIVFYNEKFKVAATTSPLSMMIEYADPNLFDKVAAVMAP